MRRRRTVRAVEIVEESYGNDLDGCRSDILGAAGLTWNQKSALLLDLTVSLLAEAALIREQTARIMAEDADRRRLQLTGADGREAGPRLRGGHS